MDMPEMNPGAGLRMEASAASAALDLGPVVSRVEPPAVVERHNGDGFHASDEEAVARLVGNLASGMAQTLVAAIQDLDQHIAGENRRLSSSFRQQLSTLQSTVENLLPLKDRIEELTLAVSEQRSGWLSVQEKQERLSAATAALQEADASREKEIEAARAEARKSTTSLSKRLDALSTRVDDQHDELAGLKEVLPRMTTLGERLDRQGDAIRSLYEIHARREAWLEQVADAFSKLRSLARQDAPKPEAAL